MQLIHGDCVEALKSLPDNSVDSVVTDPPYGLEFMGKEWDAPWKSDTRQTFNGTLKKTDNPQGRSKVRYGIGGSYGNDKAENMRAFQDWNEQWAREVFRVLKPGGHLLSFAGTRTYHRMASAIEDAGFEIRDQIMWVYGSGFPKSHDISKAIDKAGGGKDDHIKARHSLAEEIRQKREAANLSRTDLAKHFPHHSFVTENWERKDDGQRIPNEEDYQTLINLIGLKDGWRELVRAEDLRKVRSTSKNRQGDGTIIGLNHTGILRESTTELAKAWQGWGTALKPAHEPIVVARKPMSEKTVAENVLRWGTGAVNIDGCRIETNENLNGGAYAVSGSDRETYENWRFKRKGDAGEFQQPTGRWPANFIHDGSEEVVSLFPDRKTTWVSKDHKNNRSGEFLGDLKHPGNQGFNDSGSAARFFQKANMTIEEKEEWHQDLFNQRFARDVANTSNLKKADADFVLKAVVEAEMPKYSLTKLVWMEPFILVTLTELRQIRNMLIGLMSCSENEHWQEPLLERLSLQNNLVRCVATQNQTDTTMITISLWRSGGYVDVATLNIMPKNLELGGKDSANKFIYCPKTSKKDRDEGLTTEEKKWVQWQTGNGASGKPSSISEGRETAYKNIHPTVKPTDLMAYLCRLVTPPGGIVLDPFMGSGSTGKAAIREGFDFIGIEREEEYFHIAQHRIAYIEKEQEKAKQQDESLPI